jgi:hypothetical protein
VIWKVEEFWLFQGTRKDGGGSSVVCDKGEVYTARVVSESAGK